MYNATRLCSVEGCDRKHAARGFCHKHYIAKRYEICDRATLEQRFWEKVDRSGGNSTCWIWTAHRDAKGYGSFESRRAHRVAYEMMVGPIPDGLQIDHLCRVTSCVNPKHLEPVTLAENLRRAAAARTRCKRGHEFTPENTYYDRAHGNARLCRECTRATGREWYRQHRAPHLIGQPPSPRRRTHCAQGHEWTPENTRIYVYPRNGKRQRVCITCVNERNARYAQKRRSA